MTAYSQLEEKFRTLATLEDAAGAMRGPARSFTPSSTDAVRQERLTRWRKALAAA